MNEIVSLLMLGLSLSMDTFSLSLTLGTFNQTKRIYIFPFIVGIFHFIMPLIGNFLGIKLISILNITSNIILGFILIILGINLAYHYFKEEKINIKLTILSVILLAFSVSIDSFTVGLGISAITSRKLIASLIFAFSSFTFTYIGLVIGKYSSKYLGKYASFIGIIILLILGIYHLFV